MPTRVLELHEESGSEYDAAFDWYLERSPDAALKFDTEFDRALAEIAQAPQRWATGPYHTRRFLLRKVPFMLIYRQRTGGEIQVIAVAHTSPQTGILERANLTGNRRSSRTSPPKRSLDGPPSNGLRSLGRATRRREERLRTADLSRRSRSLRSFVLARDDKERSIRRG